MQTPRAFNLAFKRFQFLFYRIQLLVELLFVVVGIRANTHGRHKNCRHNTQKYFLFSLHIYNNYLIIIGFLPYPYIRRILLQTITRWALGVPNGFFILLHPMALLVFIDWHITQKP